MICSFDGKLPLLDETVFVETSAHVVGDVELGADSSVWFGSVLRGDIHYIRIGARTNIQDLTVIHVQHGRFPAIVEDEVTVGHRAVLHGCHIGARSLIGMGAVVMDEAKVGPESIVAAGSVVSPGTVVPPRKLALGVPAKVVRSLTEAEVLEILSSAGRYVELKNKYLKERKST